MDRDKIIQMARDIGTTKWFGTMEDGRNVFLGVEFSHEQLEKFAAAIRADTKEEDARICDKWARYESKAAKDCAAAIRASK